MLETASVATPVGRLSLYVSDGVLCGIAFEGRDDRLSHDLKRRFGSIELRQRRDPGGLASSLRRYFAGDVKVIDEIAVDTGGTPFQRDVWAALRRIPAGQTWSYARLAAEIGAPTAVRAVGAANGRNPVSLVVPCHRVIASDGTLCGYGGGLDRKRWLLAHEGARFVERPAARQESLSFG